MCTKIHKLIILILFSKVQILGCYNSTPLKMNLIPEIRGDGDKRDADSPPLDSSLPCIHVDLTPSNLSTDSKILTDTPNNTQVTPITRPLFLFSPYYQFSFLKYPPSNGD